MCLEASGICAWSLRSRLKAFANKISIIEILNMLIVMNETVTLALKLRDPLLAFF